MNQDVTEQEEQFLELLNIREHSPPCVVSKRNLLSLVPAQQWQSAQGYLGHQPAMWLLFHSTVNLSNSNFIQVSHKTNYFYTGTTSDSQFNSTLLRWLLELCIWELLQPHDNTKHKELWPFINHVRVSPICFCGSTVGEAWKVVVGVKCMQNTQL